VNSHFSGFDTPIHVDAGGSATLANVTATRQVPRKPAIALSSIGWTPARRGTFDPKAAAAILSSLRSNPFDDPKELIDHARDHIDDLDCRIRAFVEGEPYAVQVELDPNSGQEVHRLRIDRLPRKLATVAKDVLTNLRDTLDHAVRASAACVHPGRKTYRARFPFSIDANGVHQNLNRQFIDIPPEIRTYLEELRPHRAGDHLLWGLNCTRNVETHEIIVPLAVVDLGNSLRFSGAVAGPAQIGCHHWIQEKQEIEYLRVGQGLQPHYQLMVAIDIVFGDVEALQGNSVLVALRMMAHEVEGIVLDLERVTGRIIA
jgi:hypothetical protein